MSDQADRRRWFFEATLPLADALFESWRQASGASDEDGTSARWGVRGRGCFFGPTREEFERWMPMTAAAVRRGGGWWDGSDVDSDAEGRACASRPLLLPLDNGTNLAAAVETMVLWSEKERVRVNERVSGGPPSFSLYAVPPEVDFLRQFRWPDHAAVVREAADRWLAAYRERGSGDRTPEEARLREEHLRLEAAAADAEPGWKAFREAAGAKPPAALALAAVDSASVQHVLALPDSELSGEAGRPLRLWSADRIRACNLSPEDALEGMIDFGQFLQEAETVEAEDEPEPEPPDQPTEAELLEAHRFRVPAPFLPERLVGHGLAIKDGAKPRTFTLAWSQQKFPAFVGNTFMYRRMLRGEVLEEALSPAGMQRLERIADGELPRGEDDRTLRPEDLLSRGGRHWSVSEADPIDQLMWAEPEHKGYPVRTVGEACHACDRLQTAQLSDFRPGDAVVPLRGAHAVQARRVVAEPVDLDGDAAEELLPTDTLAADAAAHADVLRLRSDAPELLVRQLVSLRSDLIARGLGSRDQPIIPWNLVRDAKVYWPPKQERDRLLASSRGLEASCDRLGEDGDVQSAITALGSELKKLGEAADPSGMTVTRGLLSMVRGMMADADPDEHDYFPTPDPVSPFWYQNKWALIRDRYEQLGGALRDIAGSLWDPAPAFQVPLTIGFHARRTRAEPDADPTKRLFERAGLLLQHHAFLGLALLEQADPAACREVVQTTWKAEDHFAGSMNHWKQASIGCIKRLADVAVPRHLERLRARYARTPTGLIDAAANALIHPRNDTAHGYEQHGAEAAPFAASVSEAFDRLLQVLEPGIRPELVRVEGRSVGRDAISLTLRHLVGDNEVTEVSQLPVDATAAGTAIDGLVHANTGDGWSLLPMDPWLVHEAHPDGGNATLWLLDGWSRGVPTYKSPLRALRTLKLPAQADRLEQILGFRSA